MSDLNKKNINYGALNRFYQNLKSHDLSGLATEQYVDDAIDNIPQYSAGENIIIDEGIISTDGYVYDASLGAISLPAYYKQIFWIEEVSSQRGQYALYAPEPDFKANYTTGMTIYDNNNIEIGTLTSVDYEDYETIYCDIDFKDGYELETGYVYHFNIPYHTLQNQNEVGLAGFTKSHTSYSASGKTLLAVGLTQYENYSEQSDGANAIEVMGNGDLYIKGIGGYQGTTLTSKKTLQTVISEKADSSALILKENKIDFTIGLNQTTPGAMPTLDLSNLNNVTTDGIYNIAIVSDIYGTGNEYFGTGKLAVQNLGEGNGIQQTLSLVSNYALPKQELIVRAYDGSDWTEQSYPCALIVPQGYEQVVPYATYSATKINELISALETRIAALEGN